MLKLKRILVKEGNPLYSLILSLMVVVCVLLIIVVAMQPSKTNAANLTGGAEQLFGKQKARGFEAFLISRNSCFRNNLHVISICISIHFIKIINLSTIVRTANQLYFLLSD